MSNEIKLICQMLYSKGLADKKFQPNQIQLDQTTQGAHCPIVTVNSSAYELIPKGDVGTPGIFVGRNLDTSNYVTVAVTTSSGSTAVHPFAKIEAKEPFLFRWANSMHLKWKANSAAVKIDMQLLED